MNFSGAKRLLIAAAALVAIEFFLFGKALSNLAPPVDDVGIKVGITSFVSLVVLLVVSLVSKDNVGKRYNRMWVAVSIVFLAIGIGTYFWYESLQDE